MSNFTPGPWSVGATDPDTAEIEIVSEGRPYVCLALPGAVDGRTEANARLIAAAPDMLEVLTWVAGSPDDTAYWIKQVHAAIAKATGGAA